VGVLAGGLATRMRPLTEKTPKSLLEVAGRPFIFWQLERLKERGVREVVLCIGFLGEQIQEAVGDGTAFGLSVHYASDSDRPLGTAGALRRALPLLGEQFFVLYGDSYLTCSFAAVQAAFAEAKAPALMTVMRNEGRWDRSNVLFRDGRLLEYNKRETQPSMAHIDYGLGVLSAVVLASLPEGRPADLGDIYHDLSLRGELAGFEVEERFYEIGSAAGLRETDEFLLRRGGNR
jgi:MurNAc alpha-1-phosphate uridylyltransferase